VHGHTDMLASHCGRPGLTPDQVMVGFVVDNYIYAQTRCFKKSFATLKAYINLFRGHVQSFELS
jgi:hypothetical protein